MDETTLICYRGACDSAAHLRGYNRVTHGLYCLGCARLIDRGPPPPGGSMFPLMRLALAEGGSWEAGLVRVREGT